LDDFKIINGKKFMWDGEDYESEAAAKENISKYAEDGFDTKLVCEEGKFLVYSRRVVTDVVVEGAPV